MNPQIKEREKIERKHKIPSLPPPPSFTMLPEEIAMTCLARISRSYYPTLSLVCKSFRSLLPSTELYATRSHLGTTERCLYVCLWDHTSVDLQWFELLVKPNRILLSSSMKKIEQLLAQESNTPFLAKSIVVGSEIYVIGGRVDRARSSAVRIFNCQSYTWRNAPNMIVARTNPYLCVYDGKIFVMGGRKRLKDEQWGEVFDAKTQTWESFSCPLSEIRNKTIFKVTQIQGKIYVEVESSMYAYDIKQGYWECFENKGGTYSSEECMMENVWFSSSYFLRKHGGCMCQWYDIKNGIWKNVSGLDSLYDKCMRTGGSQTVFTKLVSCGGKLLLIWEGHPSNYVKEIWCAQIVVEKQDGGDVWGNVEWVDVVHSLPTSSRFLHCLAVSV